MKVRTIKHRHYARRLSVRGRWLMLIEQLDRAYGRMHHGIARAVDRVAQEFGA